MMNITEPLKRLENWIASWRTENGSHNGMIATFWEGTLDTIQANSVHQAPLIRGYLNLYTKTGNRAFLTRAIEAADFLLQDLNYCRHYSQTSSDIPGKPAGPIQDIECDLALLELFKLVRSDQRYLDAVTDNVQHYILKRWWNRKVLSHQVANQIAKSGELFVELFWLTNQKMYLEHAIDAGDWLVNNQIVRGPFRGAIEQSYCDSRLIWVYQAPCIPFLVKLYHCTQNEEYLRSANTLGDFIQTGSLPTGGFIGLYEQGIILKLINYAIREITPLRPMGTWLKKILLSSFVSHYFLFRSLEPVFIARTAEIINNLSALEEVPNLDKHTSFILTNQLTSGGIRNWTGRTPTKNSSEWAGEVPSMRWNMFVFELLSKILSEDSIYPDVISDIPPSYNIVSNDWRIVETQYYFALLKNYPSGHSVPCIYSKSDIPPADNLVNILTPKNLLIVTPIFPPEVGGCASRMGDFTQFLNKNKWNINVVTNQVEKPATDSKNISIVRIPLFVSWKQVKRFFITVSRLIYIIKKNKIDVVMVTTPPGLHAALTIYVAKLLRARVVLDIRDPWITGEVATGTIAVGSWKYRTGRYLEKLMFTKADAIISVYQSVARNIINRYRVSPDKVHWIPNGVNRDLVIQTDTANKASNSQLQNRTVFLYQGLLARPQDLDRVIDTIPEIAKQVPDALFVFIGDGEEKNRLVQKVQERSLNQSILFKDRMERKKVLEWIRMSDYGLISLSDQFDYAIPSKLFDYLIFRKPIVAVVPKGGEADKLIKKYQLGVNLLTTSFRPLKLIKLDNPIYTEYDRKTNANRLDTVLSHQTIVR